MRFILLLLLLLSACEMPDVPATAALATPQKEHPQQESWGVQFYITENTKPLIQVSADQMARYETDLDSTYALMTTDTSKPDSLRKPVTVRIFDDKGASTSTVLMQKLTFFEKPLRFIANGKVKVQMPGNRTLESDHVEWNNKTRRLKTRGSTRFSSPTEQIEGFDLETDEGMENYTFQRITGQFYVRNAF